MKVKSFAMLLPCGIDVFSGVEFVCCPFSKNTQKGAGSLKLPPLLLSCSKAILKPKQCFPKINTALLLASNIRELRLLEANAFFLYAERLEEKQSLTSSWPKELKLQPIENEKFDDEDDLDDEDEDDYDEEEYEYDDEDDYEDEDYDDEYYDEEFYENEVRKVQLFSTLVPR